MPGPDAKARLRRAAAVATAIACAGCIAVLVAPAALASLPAEVQYNVAAPPAPPSEAQRSEDASSPEEDSPAGAVLDSLSDRWVVLVLALVVLGIAVAVAVARDRRLATRRRLGIGIAALALSALLLIALPGGAQPPPPLPKLFWGVVPQTTPPAKDFRRMRAGGVDSVRIPVPWSAIEQRPGTYDWAAVDPAVRRAARSGLEVLPFIAGTPAYLASDSRTLPIRTRAQRLAWGRFLRALARRYGPGGSFWTKRLAQGPARLPYRPIRSWQIWNEPNFFYFAKPRSPAAYARVVSIAHRAITKVDPRAKIVLAGLFARPRERPPRAMFATDFLRGVYQVPHIKDRFDAVALHPYEVDAVNVARDITAIRAVMAGESDGHAPLLITELGWGSGRGGDLEKGRSGQAEEMDRALSEITERQRKWRISRVYWFSWDDLAGTCNFCDSSGLIARSGRAKPAWHTYQSFARGEG